MHPGAFLGQALTAFCKAVQSTAAVNARAKGCKPFSIINIFASGKIPLALSSKNPLMLAICSAGVS